MAVYYYPNCDCCGGGPPVVDCCPNALPTTLFLTATDPGGEEGPVVIGTVTLTWNSSSQQWEGSGTFTPGPNTPGCSGELSFAMYCGFDESVLFKLACSGSGSSDGSMGSYICDPFFFEASDFTICGCAPTVTITE